MTSRLLGTESRSWWTVDLNFDHFHVDLPDAGAQRVFCPKTDPQLTSFNVLDDPPVHLLGDYGGRPIQGTQPCDGSSSASLDFISRPPVLIL